MTFFLQSPPPALRRRLAGGFAIGLVVAALGTTIAWRWITPLAPHALQTEVNSGADIAYRSLPATRDLPILLKKPEEARRQGVLAGTLMQVGLDGMAVSRLKRAVAADPADKALHVALGEALVLSHGGKVVPEAKAEFDLVLAGDPNDLVSRFYMAAWLLQNGKPKPALVKWVGLMRTVGKDDVWNDRLWDAMPEAAEQIGVDRIALKALCTAGM